MDIKDITIEDIIELRPDLYQEISKEALKSSQIFNEEEIDGIIKPLVDELKEVSNKRIELLEKKLHLIFYSQMTDILSALKEKYESKKKVNRKPSKIPILAKQRNALIGDYIIWRPTGEMGKVVRFEFDGNLRKIVLQLKSMEYIKVYDNKKLYDIVVKDKGDK